MNGLLLLDANWGWNAERPGDLEIVGFALVKLQSKASVLQMLAIWLPENETFCGWNWCKSCWGALPCRHGVIEGYFTCYKHDKLVLLLEVNKRKMHRFFLVTKFFLYIYQLDCEGHSAGSRIIWSLAAVPTSRASAQLNQESVVSRQSSPAETRESKNRWNKVLEGKAWQICFCGTLSLHLGPRKVHLRIRDHPSGPCWDPSRAE